MAVITQENIQFTIQIATLLGIVFAVFKFSRDPDIKMSEELKIMKARCKLLHGNLDENISLIKNNHLAHIEKSIKELEKGQVKVFTILEERLPKKEL